MNNYAVSSDGIATALQDSASALMEAGNSLEQSVALVAAANRVVQDPNSVGSALRTISLRLRGTSVEVLEELGEETDGAVESVSKMQEKLKALAGVDILTDSGAYKDTYTILKEIAVVWDDMSNMDQAAALELMAGKNRANTLAAILNNMKDLEGAYESALNAEGSAMRENEAYLDSIQGRIDLFTNALQTFWMNLLDTSLIKGVVDFGTWLIKFLDTIYGKITLIAGGLMIYNRFKQDGVTFKKQFAGIVGGVKEAVAGIYTMVTATKTLTAEQLIQAMASEKVSQEFIKQFVTTTGLTGATGVLSVEQKKQAAVALGNALATGKITVSQWLAVASTLGLKAAFQSLGVVLKAHPLILIATIVAGAAVAIGVYNKKVEEAAKKAREYANTLKEQNDSLDDYKEKIRELRTELDSGNLSEQEAYDARKQLVQIQDELIEKYGKEANAINVVTGEINDQIDAIGKLAKADWEKYKREHTGAITTATDMFTDFDTDKLDSWNAPIGGGIEIEAMSSGELWDAIKDLELDMTPADFHDRLQELLTDADLGIEIPIAGITGDFVSDIDADSIYDYLDVYNQLYDITERLAKEYFGDNYLDYAGNALEGYSEKISELNQYIEENEVVFDTYVEGLLNYDATYSDAYGKILAAQKAYDDAILNGDDEAAANAIKQMEEARQHFLDQGFDNEAVNLYVEELFNEFETRTATIKFKAAWDGNEAGVATEINDAVKAVSDELGHKLTDQELLGLDSFVNFTNEDGIVIWKEGIDLTDAQKDAYEEVAKYAAMYNMEIDDLIEQLVKLGVVQGKITPEKVQEATSILSKLANSLDSIQSKYDTLQGAIDEFNECGAISGETLKSLIDNNLLQYLTFTENGLIADANAMQALEQAAINEAHATLDEAMAKDMLNFALGNNAQLSSVAQSALQKVGLIALESGANAAEAAVGYLTAAEAMQAMWDASSGNLRSDLTLDQITTGAQAIYDQYQGYHNIIGQTSAYKTSDANKGKTSSAKEIDWIEHYYTEIENKIDELNARLENKISNVQALDAKNTIIDKIIDLYDEKQQKLANAIATYDARADYLFGTFSSDIQNKINNGSLDISKITDENLASNIEEYYGYIEAASQARVEAEELKQTIADLAKQKFDNISTAYENEIGLVDAYIDALQDQIDATEARGEQVGASYYESMIDSAEKRKQSLEEERNALQESLDEAVKLGQVEVGSDTWYEMVNAIYEVDSAIVEAENSMEEWQTAINDLHWDNFDKLISKLDGIASELDNIYERLTDNDEAFDENGDWTNQGIAALGMLTQKMEQAQFAAQQYADQIDKLNTDYAAGKYSEEEYNEKLAELTEGQWESIEAYEAAKDEIVDLNKARVDAVKDGMQKELDAYKELIDAKKESLEADKEAHDWANQIAEKEKNISDIQRKLAALASDNSTSANAQKKKLQAELLKAQAELNEAYYDKSIEDQQDALDKEYESYEENQQKEIDSLEEWLDDREAIIQDSFDLVKENTQVVYDELLNLSQEYGVQISDEIIAPWQAGQDAIGEYKDAFLNPELNEATSAFMDQLESVKDKWEETANAAEDAANRQIDAIRRQQQETVAAYAEIEAAAYRANSVGNMLNVGTFNNNNGLNNNSSNTKTMHSSGTLSQDTTFVANASNKSGFVTIDGTSYFHDAGSNTYYKASDASIVGGNTQHGVVKVKKGSTAYNYYAKGTLGTKKDELAIIDELGEELVLNAGPDGRLQYLSKGTSVIPHDISENLMKLGQLDPSDVLSRSAPRIGVSHSVANTTMNIDMHIAEVVHIDHADNSSIPDITKAVKTQMDNYMRDLNNKLRRK